MLLWLIVFFKGFGFRLESSDKTSLSELIRLFEIPGSLGALSLLACQGIFGCPLRVVGYATSVILNLQGLARAEWEKIRVCNYCVRQWQQGLATSDYEIQGPCLDFSNFTICSKQSFYSALDLAAQLTVSSITLGSMPYLS
ncbi:hypothetical protein NC652_007786 [Populus alba x Populus x berolinensis]|nr:hypothetical protein NC652_007786 [Populus alba x Populus x berolinensis]